LGGMKWLKRQDAPDPRPLIEVVRPSDETKWLALEGFFDWDEPVAPEFGRYEIAGGDLWYSFRAYVIKKTKKAAFKRWAPRCQFMGKWMPEPLEIRDAFLGEFCWAPSFASYGQGGGSMPWVRPEKGAPGDVLVATTVYKGGFGEVDGSVKESFSLDLPAPWLAAGMGLSWRGRSGEFFDHRGELLAQDPSVNEKGPGTLLVRRDEFLAFLRSHDLDVFWALFGEKRILPAAGGSDYPMTELSGAYWYERTELTGEMSYTYQDYRKNERKPRGSRVAGRYPRRK
jgi:hypothetical protein